MAIDMGPSIAIETNHQAVGTYRYVQSLFRDWQIMYIYKCKMYNDQMAVHHSSLSKET